MNKTIKAEDKLFSLDGREAIAVNANHDSGLRFDNDDVSGMPILVNAYAERAESPAGNNNAIKVHPMPGGRHLIQFTTTAESFLMKRAESENVQFSLSYEIADESIMIIILVATKKWERIGLDKGEKKVTISLFEPDDSIYIYP